jgi:hypothetical protein
VGKVGNGLIGPILTLIAKHYAALKYTKEDENELITHFQCLKKTRKMKL